MLVPLLRFTASRERLFIFSLLGYLVASVALGGCARQPAQVGRTVASSEVVELVRPVGLPAKPVELECEADSIDLPPTPRVPVNRRQRRQLARASRQEEREVRRGRATLRQVQLNASKQPRKVKYKNVGNTTSSDYFRADDRSKTKDQSTTRELTKTKDQRRPAPVASGRLASWAWLLPLTPYVLVGGALCWSLNVNPLGWLVVLIRRRKKAQETV